MTDTRDDVIEQVTEQVTVHVLDGQVADHLPDLRWELHDLVLAGASTIVVDVSRARHLSSATLACLLCVHRRCRARGGSVVIRGGSRAALDLLHRNGLHRVFRVEGASPAGPYRLLARWGAA